jgi:D-alanyl-D-alanine carboxypeptidase
MSLGHPSRLRLAFVGLLATLTFAAAVGDQAQARPGKNQPRHHKAVHGPSYSPPYAAIVIDDKTGKVLHEASADEPRHPASLTKIMTLYLLFEQLESGKLKSDTPLPISAFAASQRPTKLGLKADQTLKVDDAIRGLVTKSANDAAVVVAEALGGSEEEFAKLMTAKAKTLGMAGTVYVNASGLPAEEQITTARDQALLGRAIQHRFPGYYRYFATPSFHYRGKEMRNHNGLLGNVKGVDGIKTGYTDASGYNLVCSVRRDEKQIVAVVLGGKSNAKRDARMRELIVEYLPQASNERTVTLVGEPIPEGVQAEALGPGAPALASTSTRSADGPRKKAKSAKPAADTDSDTPRRRRRAASNANGSEGASTRSRHVERKGGTASRAQ